LSEKLRVDKLLAHAGYGTRSEIKKAVKLGKVFVNEQKVKDSGIIVDPAVDVLHLMVKWLVIVRLYI